MILANEAMAQGILTSVNWVSDSYSSYDVILSGTGLGWTGVATSTSGLWQLNSENFIQFPSGVPSELLIGNEGTVTYLGQLPSDYPTPPQYSPDAFPGNYNGASISTDVNYSDFFPLVAPIYDGQYMDTGYLNFHIYAGYPSGLNWSGLSSISVTSIPDLNDTSTWTWQAEYYASGTSLEPAPEPATISIATLATLLGIANIKRKQRDAEQVQVSECGDGALLRPSANCR